MNVINVLHNLTTLPIARVYVNYFCVSQMTNKVVWLFSRLFYKEKGCSKVVYRLFKVVRTERGRHDRQPA